MGRWGDGEIGRWGDREIGSQISFPSCLLPLASCLLPVPYSLFPIPYSLFPLTTVIKNSAKVPPSTPNSLRS
ncbi:hypothetical protein [Moorena sp. SIO4G3]|uniref:hypothetical protein n=1 Tax=Moorena sp. SIO4G3 TaxID=2607821 RepID=UPI0014293121|nr:hypothetical protein [Moorena sp. SIO4G3]NEO76048.1 hypothetical protein [Moorena sp. SIO4G3]